MGLINIAYTHLYSVGLLMTHDLIIIMNIYSTRKDLLYRLKKKANIIKRDTENGS